MPRNRPEQALHQQVAKLLDLILIDSWWSTLSAGVQERDPIRSKILKGLGQKTGLPDILIIHESVPVFIELKSKRGRLSPEQKATHDLLRRSGASVHLARSLQDVLVALHNAGIPYRMVTVA